MKVQGVTQTMSSYTTEVRFICEHYAELEESVGFADVEEVLEKSYNKVFDFTFPLFDSSYKPTLCKNILRYYYTREIGEETVGLWKMRLNSRLNAIMPYYNKLYESALIEFSPFDDTDYTVTHTGSETGGVETSGNTDFSGTVKDRYSATPQGGLKGIEADRYLTNAEITNTDNNTDSTFNENRNLQNQFVETVKGKRGAQSKSKLLEEYRKTLLNIDFMIIEELNDLFFGLWE